MKKLLKLSICALGLGMMLSGMSSMAMQLNDADSANFEQVYTREIQEGKCDIYAQYYARLIVIRGMSEEQARKHAEKFTEDYYNGVQEIRRSGESPIYSHFFVRLMIEGRDGLEASGAAKAAEEEIKAGHSLEEMEACLIGRFRPVKRVEIVEAEKKPEAKRMNFFDAYRTDLIAGGMSEELATKKAEVFESLVESGRSLEEAKAIVDSMK